MKKILASIVYAAPSRDRVITGRALYERNSFNWKAILVLWWPEGDELNDGNEIIGCRRNFRSFHDNMLIQISEFRVPYGIILSAGEESVYSGY